MPPTGHRASADHLLPKRPSTTRVLTRKQLRLVYDAGAPPKRAIVIRRRLIHSDFVLARKAFAIHFSNVSSRMAAALDAWADDRS